MSCFKNKLDNLKLTFSFDDVLIKPSMSSVLPADTDLSVKLNDFLTLEVPVLSAAMDTVTEYEMARKLTELGGAGPLHKNLSFDYLIDAIKKISNEFGKNKPCMVAIGVDTPKSDIASFIEHGCNILVVDSAHGHSANVGDMVEYIRKKHPSVFLIAGNVVTAEAAEFLIKKGANGVKVGIGPGSICTTRKITGVGSGQLSSIVEVAVVCKKHGVLTVSDGGIRSVDEIMKSIAVGADLVMLGYMLAGSDECPGDTLNINGDQYKPYRGMGCMNAMRSGSASRYNKADLSPSKWISEGVEGCVKVKGPVAEIIHHIVWGVKTALGYVGARNIKEAYEKIELVRITHSVLKKSDIHSIEKIISTQ